jgi:hypothetical protein
MKQLVEMIGGLFLLFGGLSTLGLQGLKATQSMQSMAVGAVGSPKKEVKAEEKQVNLQTTLNATGNATEEAKTPEEYYDYKEDWEMWEKMKFHYKDYYYAGGVGDEQSN